MSDLQEGFLDLEEELSDYLKALDDQEISQTLKTGADEFKNDLGKLPKPRSRINTGSHTHILDTFATKQEDTGWLVGWGKYYGPILEHGWKNAGSGKTSSHGSMAHFYSCFKQNREKYYKDMISKTKFGK